MNKWDHIDSLHTDTDFGTERQETNPQNWGEYQSKTLRNIEEDLRYVQEVGKEKEKLGQVSPEFGVAKKETYSPDRKRAIDGVMHS
jgi:hypothetical protein